VYREELSTTKDTKSTKFDSSISEPFVSFVSFVVNNSNRSWHIIQTEACRTHF